MSTQNNLEFYETMLIIGKIFNNNHKLKSKSRINRAALRKMRKLGFFMPNIRRALLKLNNIESKELLDGGISNTTITHTLDGRYKKNNKTAMKNISRALSLRLDELFQDQDAL